MSSKQINVTCPCCQTLISVDVLTAKVLRHAPPGQVDETGKAVLDMKRWDLAKDRVEGRAGTAKDKFESALGKEHSREDDLDDLFDRAQEKLKQRKERLEDE